MTEFYKGEEMRRLRQQALQQMAQLGEGLHHCGRSNFLGIPVGFSRGWVEVERKENPLGKRGYWSLMWTSHKEYHQSLNGSALWVQFYPEKIGIVGKSHITLHKVHQEQEKREVVRSLVDKLGKAFKYNK